MTRPLGKLVEIDHEDVTAAYRRWAPVYDSTFGKFVEAGVKQAAARANDCDGRLLDVGVGTGLALPHYKRSLRVTGIDLSADMLQRACERARKKGLTNIEALLQMDATKLSFADHSFDIVVAMYVMTVVPDPAAVMNEIARVTRPGGTALIVNHFSVDKGLRGAMERRLAGLADVLGWRPEFPVETVLACDELELVDRRAVKPFGFFTLLEFRRR